MTPELVLTIIGGAGFLAGVAALLSFLNTRKSTKSKGSADAIQAWQTFMGSAVADREAEHARVLKRRDELYIVRGLLIDLVQALIESLRFLRAPSGEIESYLDRLDDIRRK